MPITGEPTEVYHVFLSSPGDMSDERDCVRKFFESFNRSLARLFRIRFEVVDWENYTDIGLQDVQHLITAQTLEEFRESLALVIGLMGQRFGGAGNSESGTLAEFDWSVAHRAKHGYPEIKWFFRRIAEFVAPGDADTEALQEAVAQWEKVRQFRKSYGGLYREFANTADFSEVIREDLLRWFARWISKKRLIEFPASRPLPREEAELPDFLDNRLIRTLRIVTALEDMERDPSEFGDARVRICAVMSSLAIDDSRGVLVGPGDEEYLQLVKAEREAIERLLRNGVTLNVLLTWNTSEMLGWQERTREGILSRLRRLGSFCAGVLEDEEIISRTRFVHLGIRERNLLILGTRYLFEGRKLSTKPGFEATEVITCPRRVAREIEMFDILSQNAVENARRGFSRHGEKDVNRLLLEDLLERIETNIKELAGA